MKIFFALLLLGVMGVQAVACDLCSGFLGINPNYNQHTINMRYRVSSFAGNHSHLTEPGDVSGHQHQRSDAGKYLHEYFETYEVWARLYPVPKLQLTLSLPYAVNMETDAGQPIAEISGLRDAFALAQYQLVNSVSADSGAFQHRLLLGGGLKLPTGMHDALSNDGTWNPLLQPGTGSLDAMVAATWFARFGRLGMSTDVLFSYNTTNAKDYRFANRLNTTAHLFYQWKRGNVALMPFSGIYCESAAADHWQDVEQLNTGGTVCFSSSGLELYLNRFSISGTIQLPAYERLNGNQGTNETRYMVGIGYALNK